MEYFLPMNKRSALLIFLAFFMASAYSVQAQNVFARKNLTSVSVDKLGEEEILLFKQSFESKNLTSSEALRDLSKKGMSEAELRKLKVRLTQLGQLDPGEQAQMLTMRLMQLQDSLQDAQQDARQLSGLERLYALDSNVFGAELFRSKAMDFAPNLTLATPPTYRLGNGDIVSLTVYGFQELNVDVAVKPDGTINIPYSGVVSVSGLTVSEAKAKIKKRLSSNGYNTLADGTSQLSLSLKEIRSVDITVIGAKVPGRYTVPGIASPYHVLHLASGPAAMGSYRSIFHIRNGDIVGEIDLYELLGKGTKNDDLRLEDGDVIFIPPHSGRISLDGEFKRARTFEMRPGESFEDIFELSGGFTEQAFKNQVFVERITEVGFEARTLTPREFSEFLLRPGDRFVADTLNDRFRQRIALTGAVQSTGYFGLNQAALTLGELLQIAGGYREDAIRTMAVISRQDSAGKRAYASVYGDVAVFALAEGDSILIPSTTNFIRKEFVQVSGEVNQPGELRWAEGLTVWDAILLSGGFSDDADMQTLEYTAKGEGRSYRSIMLNEEEAKSQKVRAGDLISVKRTRLREQVASVTIEGEVVSQGAYGLSAPFESLQAVLSRSGGLTQFADPYGAYIVRQVKLNISDSASQGLGKKAFVWRGDLYSFDTIAISASALQGRTPFSLENRDQIFIGAQSTSVKVGGEVYGPKRVSYQAGLGFNAYLRLGGGVTQEGNNRRAYVVYPNGLSRATRRVGFWLVRPKVVPGSTIVVPQKPLRSQQGWGPGELSALTGTLASISTMTIAIVQLLKP